MTAGKKVQMTTDKKKKVFIQRLVCLTTVFLTLLLSSNFLNSQEFQDTALGKEMINLGMKFLDDPGDFFFNLHTDSEDFSPVPSNKNGTIRFNLFPASLPFTWLNLNLKAKLFNEQSILPQIDLVGQYGDMLALNFISSDIKPSFSDYSAGAVFTKSATNKTKFFCGAKYSNVSMNVNLSSSSTVGVGEFRMEELNFKVSGIFILMGLTHQKDVNKSSLLTVQMGYGFDAKKITSRITLSKKHLDFGLDIFPEGLFVIHPFIAYRWNI
ncbi:MAG: hypothetical protein ABID79_06240 [Elusimicrobiota bacterium]